MVRGAARPDGDARSAGTTPLTAVERLHRVATDLAALLLPPICASCESPLPDAERLICGLCWSRVALLPGPRCARCGHPSRPSRSCPICALLPPFVRSARSLCWIPDEPASAILGALKYDGWQRVGTEIGERLSRLDFPPDVRAECDGIVPVPLAAVRQRERGFNQAEVIARSVATAWGIPVETTVIARRRATVSQTRLTPGERLANVHGAFCATEGCTERVQGRHLVLVDDVLTTGATLNACAAALFAAGARTMSFLTFGRARASGDR